ncbi:MAG: amidohydrolase [Desulfobacterales bacterium]
MQSDLDLIIQGNILTLSDACPRVEAVGIKDGRIAVLGAASQVVKGKSRRTQYLDLKNKTIIPGFIDTHVHPCQVGAVKINIDLTSVTSVKEILEKIRKRVSITPLGELVLALNFNYDIVQEHRLPTKKELDDISREHPIIILVYDVHSAMLNTRALEMVNAPRGVEGYVFGSDGNPTGLMEDPAIELVTRSIQPRKAPDVMAAVAAAAREALSKGITSLHMKEIHTNMEFILHNEDSIPIRIKPMVVFKPQDGDALSKILRSQTDPKRATIALFADGAPDSKTAAFFEPYCGDSNNYGMLYYQDDELEDIVAQIHKTGFQVSIHACGTRAAEQVLKIYAKVLAQYPRKDHRHRIEHFEMPLGNQIKRAVDLGVALAMQPMFLFLSGDNTIANIRAILGAERTRRWKPFRSILDAGALVAGGSDAPVTPMSPLKGIWAAVNHPNQKERITLYEALQLFTVKAARIGFEEDVKGSIEVGKLADFAVLAEDPYSIGRNEIGDVSVEMTLVGGKIVYSAPKAV